MKLSQKRAIYYSIAAKEIEKQEQLIKSKNLWNDFSIFRKSNHYRYYKMALTQFIRKYCK